MNTAKLKNIVYSVMADGATSSRFSILHSSKNSNIGDGWEPTEMYAIKERFFTSPTAPPCEQIKRWEIWNYFINIILNYTKYYISLINILLILHWINDLSA